MATFWPETAGSKIADCVGCLKKTTTNPTKSIMLIRNFPIIIDMNIMTAFALWLENDAELMRWTIFCKFNPTGIYKYLNENF